MRECLVVVVVLVSLVHPVHTKDMADESPPNIRTDSRFLRDALRIGLRQSPTFATMVGELAQSNLIIHVETSLELPRGMGGMLRFVTASRYDVGSVSDDWLIQQRRDRWRAPRNACNEKMSRVCFSAPPSVALSRHCYRNDTARSELGN